MKCLLFFVSLFAFVCCQELAELKCRSYCERQCKTLELDEDTTTVDCKDQCFAICYGTKKTTDATVSATPIGYLNEAQIVTGAAARPRIFPDFIYFVTQLGDLFRLNIGTDAIEQLSNLNILPHVLDTTFGKGVYNVAFDLDHRSNGVLYFYFSKQSTNKTAADHYNVIRKYELVDTRLAQKNTIKQIPQYSPERSGGWLEMGMRKYVMFGDSYLFYSNGGNVDYSNTIHQANPYASTISILTLNSNSGGFNRVMGFLNSIPEDGPWTEGVKNPLYCSKNLLLNRFVYCIVEDTEHNQFLYKLKAGRNYADNSTDCGDSEEADCFTVPPYGGEPLERLSGRLCPITSIMLYEGNQLSAYYQKLLLLRSTCFMDSKFHPMELLSYQRNAQKDTMDFYKIPLENQHRLLFNATFIGSELFDAIYVSGFSPKSHGNVVMKLQEINH